MLINKKLATAIATGAILLSTVTPAFATTGSAAGNVSNGAESTNNVSVAQNNTTTATQTNTANITNNVKSKSSTGDNSADFNTGGDSSIVTGGASNGVTISNTANNNQMTLSGMGGGNGSSLLQNMGNGSFSDNNTALSTNNRTDANQTNSALFGNTVDSSAKTGGNSSSDNTNGNSSVVSGAAQNGVAVNNVANQNVFTGNNGAFGLGSALTLSNTGNGSSSDNNVVDTTSNSATVGQSNSAAFYNVITGGAFTGKNTGDFNTDGSTRIKSGDATNETGVSNAANTNVINQTADCGCALTGATLFSNESNGAFSYNNTAAALNNAANEGQANAADFSNVVDPSAFSGHNSANDGTGSLWLDGLNSVTSGRSSSVTVLENSSNANTISSNGMNVGGLNFSWNPQQVLSMFGF